MGPGGSFGSDHFLGTWEGDLSRHPTGQHLATYTGDRLVCAGVDPHHVLDRVAGGGGHPAGSGKSVKSLRRDRGHPQSGSNGEAGLHPGPDAQFFPQSAGGIGGLPSGGNLRLPGDGTAARGTSQQMHYFTPRRRRNRFCWIWQMIHGPREKFCGK